MGNALGDEDLPLDLLQELTRLSVDAVSAETLALGEHSRQFLLARLAILERIRKLGREEQDRLVDDLRSLPADERGKWSEIGAALGVNPGAAAKRFSGQPAPRKHKPGHSLSEAAALLGISPATVHAKAHANQDAKWLKVVPTNGSVRTEEFRITNLEELAAASANWGSQKRNSE